MRLILLRGCFFKDSWFCGLGFLTISLSVPTHPTSPCCFHSPTPSKASSFRSPQTLPSTCLCLLLNICYTPQLLARCSTSWDWIWLRCADWWADRLSSEVNFLSPKALHCIPIPMHPPAVTKLGGLCSPGYFLSDLAEVAQCIQNLLRAERQEDGWTDRWNDCLRFVTWRNLPQNRVKLEDCSTIFQQNTFSIIIF